MIGAMIMAFCLGTAVRYGYDLKDNVPDIKDAVTGKFKTLVSDLNAKVNKEDNK